MAVPMTITTEGAAGNLVPVGFEQALINLIWGESEVLRYIPASSRWWLERIDDIVPVALTGMEPSWTAESIVKHQDCVVFDHLHLFSAELTLLTAASDQLLTNSVAALQQLIAASAAKGYATKLDRAILGVAADQPAEWTPGAETPDFESAAAAAVQTFDGGSYTDVGLLFSAALAAQEALDNFDPANAHWFLARHCKQVIRDGRTVNGMPLWVPAQSAGPDGELGTIYGVPVHWVRNSKFTVGTDGFLVDMSKFAWGAKQNSINYAQSNEASYTVSAALVSAFERNETVYKWWASFALNNCDHHAVCMLYDVEEAVAP